MLLWIYILILNPKTTCKIIKVQILCVKSIILNYDTINQKENSHLEALLLEKFFIIKILACAYFVFMFVSFAC